MRTPLALSVALIAATMLTGCSSSSLKDENALLQEENQTLRDELDQRNAALETTSQELRDRDIRIAELTRDLDDSYSQGSTPSGTTGFENIDGVSGSFDAGEVTASVESDILFDSGKAELKPAARRTLDAVAQVLNGSYAGRQIKVAGHTDTDPIKKSGFASNYHLGFERAFAVREYLVSRGVSAGRIYLASHGPNEPLATRAASRRVEIIVVLN